MSEREPDDESPPPAEAELSGPIGWLFGLINSFLMLGVKLGVTLVQGIFGAFLGGARPGDDPPDQNSEPPAAP